RLALALADTVVPFLPSSITQQATPTWASREACEKDLGLTDWNRWDVYDNVRRRFLKAPFTGQAGNDQKVRTWQNRLEELKRHLNATNVEPATRIYLEAIRSWPEDFRLHSNYAEFLEATRHLSEAVAEWKTVQSLLPHHHLAYFQVGRLLAEEGKRDEA